MDVIKKADLPPHLSPLDILHAFRFILQNTLYIIIDGRDEYTIVYPVLTLIFNQIYYSALSTPYRILV